MQTQPGDKSRFVQNVLPWCLAAAALAAYVLTINPWVSIHNAAQVTRLYGWSWTVSLIGPAYHLVTLPLQWLPVNWIPMALNLFSMACAVLVLGQLARSVALLPHDRTHEQRLRETGETAMLSIPLAWVPPILAVVVCGLQLTFWEHATNGTGEMFDLLLLSYIVRSLLEYRIDRRDSRLMRTAVVYGVAMTNNFAMVGFLPVFVAAILWIRGLSFFNFTFLSRITLFGLAGLSLYLLLPILAMFQSIEPIGFWAALKTNLGYQMGAVFQSPYSNKTVATLALTTLLPVLILSIRWASYFGDSSRLGMVLATLMFHIVHVGFLIVCVWVFFDPPFSPRVKGAGLPFLTFYYLGALSVGYFSGYCLLVFRPSEGFSRFELPFSKLINVLATALVIGLLAVASAGLLWRNLPHMRVTNGPAVRQFAELLAEGLPQGGAVLTDEAPRYSYILTLTRSWLQLKGREKNYMFLDTQSLLWPAYHTYLHKVYPGKWEELPADLRRETIGSRILVKRLLDLAKNTNIYYLHPSWGYYFEVFYPEPHGLVYAMKPYEREALLPPRLSDEVIAENEAFWKRTTEQALKPLLAAAGAPSATEELPLSDRILEKLHVPREKIVSASLLKSYDSRALNHWGVQMQRLGDPKRAAEHFDLALKLNPDNVVARVNLQWNKNLRAGNTASVTNIEESLGDYRAFGQAINANGPYDEPVICYFQGWIFLQLRYYRQAALSLDRVRQFWPEDLACRIALSQINLFANFPDHALEMIGEIRSRFDLTITNLADVVALESSAWFAKQEPDKAREILDTAIKENPTNALLLANATSIYMRRGEYTNALKTVERRLKLNPDEPGVLVNKAYVSIQLEDFAGAIAALDRAITLDPKNEVAVLNRAIAYLRLGRLDRAETDYLLLEKTHTNQFQIQYGLGEIAWQRKDTNEAIRRYQRYLTNAPPDSAEAKLVAERLSRLKGKKSN